MSGHGTRLFRLSHKILPTGITKKMFLSVIGFGTLVIAATTVVLSIISSRYLSRSLHEQLESQMQQIINTYDQQMGSLSSAVLTAYNQSSITALLGGNYSGYEAYISSRNAYNYICTVSKMNRFMDMYIFVPSRSYVMGSSFSNVSSQFDIAAAPTTAHWYSEIMDTYSTINIRSDFVPPVSGGDSCFAYIMTVYSSSNWQVKGFISATLEKKFLDGLLHGTFLEDRGFLLILNPDGSVAYASNQELLERNAGEIPDAAYFEGKTGIVRNNSLSDYYMVSDLSEYGGFRFIAFADKTTLNSGVMRLLVVILLVLFLAILIVLAGSYAISRGITRPIREMTDFIHQLEQNNFEGRLELQANDEIGELARSFNAMLDSVAENQILRRQAQLNALQKQIDPHFLYNTLETIKALAIRQDTRAVCTTLQNLGDMFRYNTNRDNKSTTTIQNELRHVQNYLQIQKIRFGERLNYEIDADETLLQCTTLKFILQPIVENSIRYAMESMDHSYLLKISIHTCGFDRISIEVTDNGPGIEAEKLRNLQLLLEGSGEQGDFGIGMKNIAQRLKLYFSDPYGLTIDSWEGHGTTVSILIPKRSDTDV